METMSERGAGAARMADDTGPRPAPGRGSHGLWLDRCELPALGGAFPIGIRLTELGTVIAVEGRPPSLLADSRFEPACRPPLRRFGPRFAASAGRAPDPGRYFVLGLLELAPAEAVAALSVEAPRFGELPWVPAPRIHAHLAAASMQRLAELPLPLVVLTDGDGPRQPIGASARFAAAARQIEEVCLRVDNRAALLHGASGVGKSTFIQHFAERIVQGQVSGPLRGATLLTLDPSLLDGGRAPDAELARNRALQRLAGLDVILFIDEAHRLFRAVNSRNDAVDLLKLLVSEHGLRLLLATNETSRVVGDEAWDRRQTPVHLGEADAAEMLERVLPARARGAAARGVAVGGDAQRAILSCSSLVEGQAQPHAAVALLERAVARALRLGHDSVPAAAVEDLVDELSGRATGDLRGTLAVLRDRVVGHQEPIADLARWYAAHRRRRARLRGLPEHRPFVAVLAGPPGVGKSELARALQGVCDGPDTEPFVVRGGDFSHESHVNRLVGAPPSYVGFGSGGELFRWIKRRSGRGVIELAEPERGCVELLERVVLPLLDGSLTSNEGDTVQTRGLCLLVTTNVGASRPSIGFRGDDRRRAFDDLGRELRRLLPQPVLSRCGGRVLWLGPLRPEDQLALLRRWSRELGEREGVALEAEEPALRQLIDTTPGLALLGARALRTAFEDRIASPLEELLLREATSGTVRLRLDADGDLTCTVEGEP